MIHKSLRVCVAICSLNVVEIIIENFVITMYVPTYKKTKDIFFHCRGVLCAFKLLGDLT